MGHNDDNLNVDKVLCISHTFHLFLGAARSALIPFLTIFFRLLGLSATQTGLLLGAKAFMTLVCAPAWTACAKRFNKKKMVLMFSLFMFMASNVLLVLIPPVSEDAPLRSCQSPMVYYRRNGTVLNMDLILSPEKFENVTTTLNSIKQDVKIGNTMPSTKSDANSKATSNEIERKLKTFTTLTSTTLKTTTSKPTTKMTTTSKPTTKMTTTTKPTTKETTTTQPTTKPNSIASENDNQNDFNDNKDDKSKTSRDSEEASLSAADKKLLRELGLTFKDLQGLSDSDLNDLISSIADQTSQSRKKRDITDNKQIKSKRSIMEKVKTKFEEFSEQFEISEYQTFVMVLMVIILGELFAAPYEKLADDCWFEYLDLLDCLERYGGQTVWRTIGYVLVPTMITAVVDHTLCILPLGIHHFYIHFFVFAVLMFAVFISGFCYPVSHHKQTAKRSRVSKGFKVLCSDTHAFAMTFTMVVLGAASAVTANFLMWKLQDLADSEMVMGVALTVAAGSEFLIQLIGRSLVKKLTPVGAVCLGLLLLVGRLVFYSFLWNPWLVLAGEGLHGMTFTLIWIALRTYPDFRINPFVMDRGALSVVNALYTGVGFAGGSMISGVIYDNLGYSILFQGTAGVVFLWGVIFLLLQKACKKKEKVRYAKLLQDEHGDDSDESVVYEEDWLEVAMKRDR